MDGIDAMEEAGNGERKLIWDGNYMTGRIRSQAQKNLYTP